jgi:hypothetical protein
MSDKKKSSKTTIAGEVMKNISLTTAFGRKTIDDIKSGSTTLRERRKKTYAVDPDMTPDEFKKSFLNFRIQVQIYLTVFFISIIMLIFQIGGLLTFVLSLYTFLMYLTYIRDIHRGRLLLRKWELSKASLPLTWAQFFKIVAKKPKYLIPLIN